MTACIQGLPCTACSLAEIPSLASSRLHGIQVLVTRAWAASALSSFQVVQFLVPAAGLEHKCQVRRVRLLRADGLRCSLVQVQSTTRLCLTRDLNEHDVVSRIMRKENYLIGMLNKGCLALHVSIPGMRKRFILSETLKWNLHRSVALTDRERACHTCMFLPGHCAACVAAPSEMAKRNLHRRVAPLMDKLDCRLGAGQLCTCWWAVYSPAAAEVVCIAWRAVPVPPV